MSGLLEVLVFFLEGLLFVIESLLAAGEALGKMCGSKPKAGAP